MKPEDLPNDIINIILEYDGRFRYRKGEFVQRIHKYDKRYEKISPIFSKKKKFLDRAEIDGTGFYIQVDLNRNGTVGLCYDYNFSWPDVFEICYFDMRYGMNWTQLRTVI